MLESRPCCNLASILTRLVEYYQEAFTYFLVSGRLILMKTAKATINKVPYVTNKQKAAAKSLLESNGTKSMAQVMRDANYAPTTTKNPTQLTDSEGFKQAMRTMGLTDDFLNKALYADIKKKKANRLGELTLAYKLAGRLKDTPEVSVNMDNLVIYRPAKLPDREEGTPRSEGEAALPPPIA